MKNKKRGNKICEKNHPEGGAEGKKTQYIQEYLRNMKNRMRSSNINPVRTSGGGSRENERKAVSKKVTEENSPKHES